MPLHPDDADEMAVVLGDERLHEFIGGHPATPVELQGRFTRLAAGSPTPGELWRNWVIRCRSDGQALGTAQATISIHDSKRTATIAWVVGVDWQGCGVASEAAQAVVEWLRQAGVREISAHVHPDHRASAAVARRVGLHPTDEQVDGEQVWRDT